MFSLAPLLLAALYGIVMFKFSAWNSRKQLEQASTVLRDPKLIEALDPIARTLDLPKLMVNVYEVEAINGLATPEGKIYITRGFLNDFERGKISTAELASVVAHELGHVALGHTRRRMIDFGGQNAARVALGMILGRLIPGIGVWIANFLSTVLAARMSQKDEYEADAYATALLIKSGIGAQGQITLFEKLDKLAGHRGMAPAWLLSHPSSPKRIAAIKHNCQKWDV